MDRGPPGGPDFGTGVEPRTVAVNIRSFEHCFTPLFHSGISAKLRESSANHSSVCVERHCALSGQGVTRGRAIQFMSHVFAFIPHVLSTPLAFCVCGRVVLVLSLLRGGVGPMFAAFLFERMRVYILAFSVAQTLNPEPCHAARGPCPCSHRVR